MLSMKCIHTVNLGKFFIFEEILRDKKLASQKDGVLSWNWLRELAIKNAKLLSHMKEFLKTNQISHFPFIYDDFFL